MSAATDFSTDEGLRRVVADMHIVPMAMSLIHLTGDEAILDQVRPYVNGPWDYSEKLPPELKAELRERMLPALKAHLRDGRPLAPISPALMLRMMSGAVGEEVDAEYEPMIRAQMGLEVEAPVASAAPERGDFKVLIVGAGVSGLLAGIKLKEAGIAFDILEKDTDVGGTWWENRYPGCAVDTPNHFYQFTFEPNDDWPHYYSRRADIQRYFAHCADKYGLRSHIRFGREVVAATLDEATGEWEIGHRASPDGPIETTRANALVTAVGQLNRPMIPDLPGLEDFRGTVVHTAEWPEGYDVAGKKVALIGSGASAIQVGPAIASTTDKLTVFQRSGAWIVRSPNIHRSVTDEMKWALKHVPHFAAWYRFQLFWGFADGLFPALRIDPGWSGHPSAINEKSDRIRAAITRYMERELEGREDLLAKVVPDYPPYGKRVLQDPGWFRMLKRDNVALVTDGIARIEPEGIRTQDGVLHEVDVIVMATGFHAGKMLWPMEITGAGGKTVREVWGDNDPRAYLGMTAPDFPNMFVLYGPNTGLSHGGSYTFLAECQVRLLMGCLTAMADRGVRSLAVKRDVFERYNRDIEEELKHLVWSHPRVRTWYKNANGRIIINSPWRLLDYWRFTLAPDFADYELQET
ncbi:flavin-containing monooxygenase [Ramlibacter sp.]|uniref:flavin-containing monooxygenase n=1 Tax=Ramlibacter sp. TaxID=1917967 RepID=UPI003D0F5CF1